MRRTHSVWPLALGAIILGGLAALGWSLLHGSHLRAADTGMTPPQAAQDMQNTFAGIAQTAGPCVVSITSRIPLKPSSVVDDGADFGGLQGPGGTDTFAPPDGSPSPPQAIGRGSGFVVRQDGYILTDDHVVSGADAVTVRLQDGREFTGSVKRDPRSDLAIVKIPVDNLPVLHLADSKQTKVGQWALAFGSPFGLRNTMTVGVVSALGREETIGGSSRTGEESRFYPNLIQTDAAVNPGNSGGPLVDIFGHVIGVNVAIGSPNGANVGIGFAIPADTALYVMDQLISRGSVVRGFLGFAPEDLSPGDQVRDGVKEGAVVATVENGSAADKAGLQVEDVITRLNDQPIHSAADLRDAVARTMPGQSVRLTILRGGKELVLTATVQSASPPNTAEQPSAPGPAPEHHAMLGIQVADLTPEVARHFGMYTETKGVVVANVFPGSPAAEAGLRPGDILLRLNGQPVNAATDVARMIQALQPGQEVSIVIERDNMRVLLRAQPR